jgi:tRNA (guanine26-N2/guanine27-N2)-dimethyltransferase
MITHVESNRDKYKTSERMLGMLTVISEELPDLMYYSIPTLSSVVHVTTPPLKEFTYHLDIAFSVLFLN